MLLMEMPVWYDQCCTYKKVHASPLCHGQTRRAHFSNRKCARALASWRMWRHDLCVVKALNVPHRPLPSLAWPAYDSILARVAVNFYSRLALPHILMKITPHFIQPHGHAPSTYPLHFQAVMVKLGLHREVKKSKFEKEVSER